MSMELLASPIDFHVVALTLGTDGCRRAGLECVLAVLTFPLHSFTSLSDSSTISGFYNYYYAHLTLALTRVLTS